MKLFVWDFHGVLEKGTESAALEISNRVLGDYGYSKRFTKDDIDRLYGKKWWEFFEDLLPEESHEKHLQLQEACYKDANNNPENLTKYVEPNDHAREVLEMIRAAGHYQILISNVTPENLDIFLRLVGMEQSFDSAFAADSRSKNEVLGKFLNGEKYESIVIIGDSPHDMELKSVAGGTTYLYSRSGNFRGEGDYKITDLREVLRELGKESYLNQ